MTYIYLATPMDEANEAKRNAAIKQVFAVLEGKYPVFAPAGAWRHAKGVPGIQEVNMHAVQRCRVLVAMVLPDTPSCGVPLEVGYAYGLGIPVVVLVANTGEELVDPPTALLGFPRTGLAGLSEAVRWAWERAGHLDSGETEESDGRVLPMLRMVEIEPVPMPTELVDAFSVMPAVGKPGDAGHDLAASKPVTIHPGETVNIPTGVHVQLPDATWGFLVGRSSSFYRKHLQVNPAVIDNGYRGELMFTVRNFGDEPYRVDIGERLAQLIIMPLMDVVPVQVDELAPSERGDTGFGSTG